MYAVNPTMDYRRLPPPPLPPVVTPPTSAPMDSGRTESSKRRGHSDDVRFQLVHKSIIYKLIWVEEWSPDVPTRFKDWPNFFEAQKHMATEKIFIY